MFEAENKELKAKIESLKSGPPSPEVSKEIRANSLILWENESGSLIAKATKWGVVVPLAADKPDWYFESNGSQYLSEEAKALINRQIRDVRFASFKGYAEIVIPILSLIVAILALFLSRA